MNRYTIQDFVDQFQQKERGQGEFELETERILEINLDGAVWSKMGSMVSYRGQIKFTREGILEQGLGTLFKKAFTGEGARLTKAEGHGKLYLADQGKKVIILRLNNESLFVNGNDLLAFQMPVSYQIKMLRRISGVLAGGLFNVRLAGSGLIAITSHYDPIVLQVTPNDPVTTDPNATIAWSGSLEPQFKTDISLKTFFGRGSGESFQMHFVGTGFVVVQPFEEIYLQAQS
jgi:uncharacterized protein (AIM24 family)